MREELTRFIRIAYAALYFNIPRYQPTLLEANRHLMYMEETQVFSYRNDSFAHVARWRPDDCDEDCAVIAYVFPGAFIQGSEYDIMPMMQRVLTRHKTELWSVAYRTLDAGSTYDDMVQDVRDGLRFVRKKTVGRTFLAGGASAGGVLLQDALAGLSDLNVSGGILDSTVACMPEATWFPDVLRYRIASSASAGCYREPVAPTFVVHSEKDTVAPPDSMHELQRRYGTTDPGVEVCFADDGEHVTAMTSACMQRLDEWLFERNVEKKNRNAISRMNDELYRQTVMSVGNFNRLSAQTLPQSVFGAFFGLCDTVSHPERIFHNCDSEDGVISSLPFEKEGVGFPGV